ncbi:L-seryl-tRNA(Sec) kinase isoform X2 [Brachyhypopomus gauderio]|uniref:L-seryl-tRNA(Sec) kinase isoform X2 n=1 Tax=Brachyhypopomus gauderio TaxID=698409 RepID=UPI004041F45F
MNKNFSILKAETRLRGSNITEVVKSKQTRWKHHRQLVLACLESFLQDPGAPRPGQPEGGLWERFILAVHQQDVRSALQNSSQPARLVLLLDDNFYYQSMRYEVYQLARKYSVGFCQVYLHCPVEECLHRNQARGLPVSDETIIEMSKRIEPPNRAKNHWEQNTLTLSSTEDFTDTNIQNLLLLLSTAMENPLSPVQDDSAQREADREQCASSVVHQADQACRRLVAQTMQLARENKVSREVLSGLARDLSEQKGRFLQELRRHVLQGPPSRVGEPLDVERLVSRAMGAFEQEIDDVLQRHAIDSRAQST